ncbi:MAG: cadherin-like beta sandwich domain-containing protein [Clostridia bacterium]|nr:cadherin-like beta sandwich domain-containing protein [Clostridia bacterium]
MKRLIFKLLIIIVSIILIYCFTNPVQAASDNANLSNLGYTPEDFKGFKPDITEYNTTVPYSIRKIQVYAKTQDSGATYEVSGNTNLEVGKNVITVTVTASNKTTKKIYTMNVTREENEMHIGLSDEEAAARKETEKKKAEEEAQKAKQKEERKAAFSMTRYSEPHTETGWIIVGVVLFIMTTIFVIMVVKGKKNKQKRD